MNLKTILFRSALVIGLLIGLLPGQTAQAAGSIIRIKTTGKTSGTCGDTWTNACELQYALSLAQSGDQLWAAAGTYKPTTGTDRTISFKLKSGVALYGGFAGSETDLNQRDPKINVSVLSGDIGTPGNPEDNSYHVVNGSGLGSNTVLDGFKITAGYANGTSPQDTGAGMYCYTCTASFANLNFRNNYAAYQGGAVFFKASNITMANINVSVNSAGKFGAGILNHTSNLTLSNSTFTGNTALERGGGLYNYSSTATLTDVTFDSNTAQILGAGLNNFSSDVQLTRGTFTGNTAGTSGGGIYFAGGALSVADSVFTANSAKGGAGILVSSNSVATIHNVTFEDNHALERGGGIYFYDSTGTITSAAFRNNTAKEHGGAMFNSSSDPVVTDTVFTGNSSELYGGAIDNNSSSPTFNNVQITGNSAIRGGGLYNWEYSSPTLNGVTFTTNSASHRGGGLYVVDYCNLTLTDVVFDRNTSVSEGGGMFVSNSHPVLTRVLFTGNSSANFGGGMYNSYTHGTLTDVIFTGNSAISGGGLNNNNSDPSLTNITFADNRASERGGGLYNYLSTPALVNVTFKGNTAGTYGGGISNSAGSLQLNHTTLLGNSAGVYGGGMWLDDTTINMHNSIFWGNSAATAGPQIYSNHSGMPIVDTSVIQDGCPSGAVCTSLLTADPALGELADHGGFTPTLPILAGSSAIDAGDPATCAAIDQRGVSRPQGARCDIGAYESDVTEFYKSSPADNAILASDAVTLTWSASSGAAGYEICVDSTDNDACDVEWTPVGNNTTYTLPAGSQPLDTSLYWQVRAIVEAESFPADRGTWWSFRVEEYTISPALNETLTTSKVTLDWEDVANASKYKLQLSTASDFSTLLINLKLSTSVYAFPTTLNFNTTYYWRIRALVNGSWTNWMPTWQFTSMPRLKAPELIDPLNRVTVTDTNVLFSWQPALNAAAYKIIIARDANFTDRVILKKVAGTEFTGMLPAGRFFWRVRAVDASGLMGPWSASRVVKVSLP